MANGFTIVHREEFTRDGKWRLARRTLGVDSFGINVVEIPPGESIPEHDEVDRDHEEVFVVLAGRPTFVIDGDTHEVTAGTFLRFDPEPRRAARNDTAEIVELMIVSAPKTSGYTPLTWA